MKSNSARGGKPAGLSQSPTPNNASNGVKNSAKRSEAAIHERFIDLLARSCGSTVTVTVSSGAKYRGLLASVDVGSDGEKALSAVLVRPVIVSEPLIDEKSNVDKTLPLKIVIQSKDLLDLELNAPNAAKKNSEKSSPTTGASSSEFDSSKQTSTNQTSNITPPAPVQKGESKENDTPVSPPNLSKPKVPLSETKPSAQNPPTSKGFKTDKDISKGFEFRKRELQRWQPDDDTLDMSLEASADDGGSWDQFKTNEEKFGVESSYDEHLYTTRVNTSAKDYKERLSRAEKLAQEIEGQSSTDHHVLEERGVVIDDSGLDEEDKYSGVLKDEISSEPPVDNRGNELMAALRNASISNGKPPAEVKPGSYVTPRQAAAHYHNDPAIISSSVSSSNKNERPSESSKVASIKPTPPSSIPAKPFVGGQPEAHGESVRLNAQSEFNALREFSANFKVPHKIPNDLLPILAKDKLKQNEIMMKQKKETGKASSDSQVAQVKEPAKPKESKSEVKKESKFKLNPKAAAFTPSKISQMSPRLTNASPRTQNQRPYSNNPSGSGINRRHNQITAVEFFGGSSKVPTAQSQKEKSERFALSFNPFLTAKKNHADSSTPLVLAKAFVTPPTWDSTVDQSFEELIGDQCSTEGSGVSSPPIGAYMQSPIMAVPGAGPHFAASGGYPGSHGMNKFPGAQSYMQNPMAAQYSQQYQMAMMYQQFQGVPPGQPSVMFAPPGVDPQFVPTGGYMMSPGFQSPSNAHANLHNGSPYVGAGPHQPPNQSYNSQNARKNNHQNKRGGHGSVSDRT